MTNSEAMKALREEFPFFTRSRIRKTYDKAKSAGQSVTEAYETVRALAQKGLEPTPRLSKFDPTGHEATLRADEKITEFSAHGEVETCLKIRRGKYPRKQLTSRSRNSWTAQPNTV